MKPWYQSRRLVTALVAVVTALVVASVHDAPQREALLGVIGAVEAALLVALGLGDMGKEAAAIRAEAPPKVVALKQAGK